MVVMTVDWDAPVVVKGRLEAFAGVPLGWALYLPEDWCADPERRHKAKIPNEVAFKTKPELGVELLERASCWDMPKAPVLGDHAYGENTWLRDRLQEAGGEYVLSVGPKTKVFKQGTVFEVPPKKPKATRSPIRPRPDSQPEPIGELIGRLGTDAAQMVTFRDGPAGEPVTSRFIFARVHAAHGWRDDQRWIEWREGSEVPPREEWLIAEWPEDREAPTDYWMEGLTGLLEQIRGNSDTIHLAISHTAAEFLMPKALVWMRRRTSAPVEVIIANSRVVKHMIAAGEADVGVSACTHDEKVSGAACESLIDDEIVIAVPLGHPWARRSSIVPAELLATPIVLRDPDAHTRQVIDDMLTRAGLGALQAACEVGSTQAAKDEAHELGLPTTMSRLALAPANRLEIVPVDGLYFQRRFCILH
jgi:DDE superfamily endonuclease/LysR substrate binding domain